MNDAQAAEFAFYVFKGNAFLAGVIVALYTTWRIIERFTPPKYGAQHHNGHVCALTRSDRDNMLALTANVERLADQTGEALDLLKRLNWTRDRGGC